MPKNIDNCVIFLKMYPELTMPNVLSHPDILFLVGRDWINLWIYTPKNIHFCACQNDTTGKWEKLHKSWNQFLLQIIFP